MSQINIFTPSELRLFTEQTALLAKDWRESTATFKSDRDIACQNQPAHSIMARFITFRNNDPARFDGQKSFVIFGTEAEAYREIFDPTLDSFTAVRKAIEQYDSSLLKPHKDLSPHGLAHFWQGYLKPEALAAAIRAEKSLQDAEKRCVEPATVIRRLILQAIDRREFLLRERKTQKQEQTQNRFSSSRSDFLHLGGKRGLKNKIRQRLETVRKIRPSIVEDIPQSASALLRHEELEKVNSRLLELRSKASSAYRTATVIVKELPEAAHPQTMHSAKHVRRISAVYDRIDGGIDAMLAYATELAKSFNRQVEGNRKRPRNFVPITVFTGGSGTQGPRENKRFEI